jgi:hypothetical protein
LKRPLSTHGGTALPITVLKGSRTRKRSGKPRSYTAETDKRILKVLDEAPPKGYARWTAPLIVPPICRSAWRPIRG